MIRMTGQLMEDLNKFMYHDSILCKHGNMDEETRESCEGKESGGIIKTFNENKDSGHRIQ